MEIKQGRNTKIRRGIQVSQKRYYEVDILYAIGTFLFVLGHSHSSNWEKFQGTILVKIIDVIYAFQAGYFRGGAFRLFTERLRE